MWRSFKLRVIKYSRCLRNYSYLNVSILKTMWVYWDRREFEFSFEALQGSDGRSTKKFNYNSVLPVLLI